MDLIEEKLSGRILGGCVAVDRHLGPGSLESIHEEALVLEFAQAGLSFKRQKHVVISYQGKPVGEHRLDYLLEDRVILELKAGKNIDDVRLAIARSYLKAAALPLTLVVNFAKPTLEIRRVVLSS